jgi:hypothetical protein
MQEETNTMPEDATEAVKLLFDLAQITMSSEELERFARTYPTLRAQADALYREEFRSEAPALAFDARAAFA